MQYWSKLLKHPKSKLHGFDSFEGLPEAWGSTDKGHFDKGGAIPKIDDRRPHDFLFVTLDAYLYSSTKTVLDFIRPHVDKGTYFYFDEFHFRNDELRAFDEFLTDTRSVFKIVAGDRGLSRVLSQCVST